MVIAPDPNQKIETYLGALRSRLHAVNDEEVCEIVEELRGHILEKAAASGAAPPEAVDAALASLGSPE